MFPISYMSIFVLIIFFIDKKLASLFYPFILLQSIFGLITIIIFYLYHNKYITTYSNYANKLRQIFDYIFKFNITKYFLNNNNYLNTILLIYSLYKIIILYIWPVNLTFKAFLYSFYLLFSYFIIYLIMYSSINI